MTERLIPAFENLCGVNAAFSTRRGGVSEGVYSSLNPGIFSGDRPENIERNLALICGELRVARSSLAFNHQVHGAEVTEISDVSAVGSIRDADCFVTPLCGVTLTCITADCVPILYCDPIKRVIGTAHAGWKGTLLGSQKATLEKMLSLGCRLLDVQIEIGPCISAAAYEVSEDVADRFDKKWILGGFPKPHLDLRSANRDILLSCGVPGGNIKVSDRCTYAEEDFFFSHRRTGLPRGTQVAFIALR